MKPETKINKIFVEISIHSKFHFIILCTKPSRKNAAQIFISVFLFFGELMKLNSSKLTYDNPHMQHAAHRDNRLMGWVNKDLDLGISVNLNQSNLT